MITVTASDRLKSMRTRAAQLGPTANSTLITEFFDGVCVQATGKWVSRNTLDGFQRTVQISWWIGCKRSSRKEVYKRFGKVLS